MRTIIEIVIMIIVAGVFFYVGSSIMDASWNFKLWSEGTRKSFAMAWGCFSTLLCVFYPMIKNVQE